MRPDHRHPARPIATLALAALLCAGAASAQPERGDPRRGPGSPPHGAQEAFSPAIDAETLAARLDRRLEEIQNEEAAIGRAKSELARGVPAGEVMRSLLRERAFSMGERMRDAHGGPGGPGERGEPGAGHGADLEYDPERLQAMLRFLRETAPQIADRVEAEILGNPERAEQVYRRMAPRMLPQMEMRDRDPEMYALRAESLRLDWQIRQAAQRVQRLSAAKSPPADEAANAIATLRDLVAQRVDLTSRERALMVERLEQRVATMRDELRAARTDRDAQVDQKVRELLDEESRRPEPPRRAGPRRE